MLLPRVTILKHINDFILGLEITLSRFTWQRRLFGSNLPVLRLIFFRSNPFTFTTNLVYYMVPLRLQFANSFQIRSLLQKHPFNENTKPLRVVTKAPDHSVELPLSGDQSLRLRAMKRFNRAALKALSKHIQ